ncbi:guanylate-binding protein, putative [Phytophthora infestans T30-4]|uniref:Guanylate-binding protein, putative n=1 Tax=Phytophthora infestans (strain T30-4) TaxID=403677 RepID=D0NRZ2_PHYIT|nr:guanylate-binding protein, putative [Phytophthora infestans T30-4]EEY63533.1 guanylate-binding protein, putative [Phytophthora infestans T30-4]|eukprot:XP_002898120.1 guanylate-binding protein, putative [Phytophthora infestans T30-4]
MASESHPSISAPLPFVTLSNDGSFEIAPEAISYLQQIRGDIAVVAIAGLYRTGKSYLLNLLLGRDQESEMFDVGNTVNACTKGIWIWGQPAGNQTRHQAFKHLSRDTTILFMDTEGLGSTQRSQTQDTRIFALALLLSSMFIYNSRGVIDTSAIEDLSLVVNLTKYIQAKAHETETEEGSELSVFFPDFLWVVRDFTLQLQEDGRKVTSKDYFESALKQQPPLTEEAVQKNRIRSLLSTFFPSRDCVTMVRPLSDEVLLRDLIKQPYDSLRPEFREQMGVLRNKLATLLKPKTMMSKVLNGAMLVSLAENNVDAFNSGSSPVIASVWDRVLESQCDQALESAKQVFQATIDTAIAEKMNPETVNQAMLARPLEDTELATIYEKALEEAEKELLQEEITSYSSIETYLLQLSEYGLDILQSKYVDNDAVSTAYNKQLLQELYGSKKKSLDDSATNSGDGTQYLQDHLASSRDLLDDIVTQYNSRALGPCKSAVLNDFLVEKMVEGIFEWGSKVKTVFRSNESTLAIAERITSERGTLRDEIETKLAEIERTRLQAERLGALHQEALDRLDKQIEEAKDERKRLEATVHEAEARRESERQEAQKQMLENEQSFHNEEKNLLQGQQQFLQKVLELERQLGEQDTEHMAELYRIEKENQDEILELSFQHQDEQEELKESAIWDIRTLKTQQEEEIGALQSELDEKKARVALLREQLEQKEAEAARKKAKANQLFSGEECLVQ